DVCLRSSPSGAFVDDSGDGAAAGSPARRRSAEAGAQPCGELAARYALALARPEIAHLERPRPERLRITDHREPDPLALAQPELRPELAGGRGAGDRGAGPAPPGGAAGSARGR